MKPLESMQSALMRSSRVFVWSATACGLFVLLAFFVAVDYDFYRRTLGMSEQVATNVAALTGQDIARNIELYDLSIQSVAEGVTDPDILYQEPGLRQKILFDKSATAPGLGALVALDENGDVFMDAISEHPRAGNFADRDYFVAHRNATHDLGLFISRPFTARRQGKELSISFSRRINKPDGSFGGLVSGSMRVSFFERLFDKVSMDQADAIVLLRDDGVLLAHNKAVVAEVGADWHAAPVFAHLAGRTQGIFSSERSMDGAARIFAFQRVDKLPLVLVVGMPTHRVLGPWWIKTLVLSGIFAIMAGSVLILMRMLDSELRRRAAAEMAAEQLARIDGLTKLSNRRWFDEELSRKWARAARDRRPISLLMIDVDYFKPFNDTYGHQEGDRVLKAIADVIGETVKRPDDIAARYGGEEFVVLLPDTDQSGANRIAAAICARVRQLRLDHDMSEHKIVTVSVGVATLTPHSGIPQSALVHDADVALYGAKGDGRNTVRVHSVVPTGFDSRISRAS